jgi:hypothetical protein
LGHGGPFAARAIQIQSGTQLRYSFMLEVHLCISSKSL